jgi:hypothetical protein
MIFLLEFFAKFFFAAAVTGVCFGVAAYSYYLACYFFRI